jgi:hypothetical protein
MVSGQKIKLAARAVIFLAAAIITQRPLALRCVSPVVIAMSDVCPSDARESPRNPWITYLSDESVQQGIGGPIPTV